MTCAANNDLVHEGLIYEVVGRTALISVDRPAQRNAWNVRLLQGLIQAINRANDAEDVRAIVLTAEGQIYSAGADLTAPREPAEAGRSANVGAYVMGQGERNWLKLLTESKPVVAAINGPAIGLGATHILAADLRIASDAATFRFPFVRLGAMPECGSTALLGRLVGSGRALDICLRAREIDAAEAMRIGLVTSLYPPDELRRAALAIAEEIAESPPLQVRLTKQMLWRHANLFDAEEIMRSESAVFVEMLRAVGRSKPL